MAVHNSRRRQLHEIQKDLALQLSKDGLEMLLCLQGGGFNLLLDPQDLLTLTLLALAIGKVHNPDTRGMFESLKRTVDLLDVTPLAELVQHAKENAS